MRTSENYDNKLINEDGTKKLEAYNDTYVKEQMVIILKQILDWDLYINPDDYGVDLLSKDGTFGVELEHGGWNDDFWLDKYYPYKSKELNYPHVNMPSRKKKWYKEYYNVNLEPDRNKKPIWGKKHNPTFENNVFIRTNKQLTQMIIIWPDTVFTNSFEDKMIYANNSGKVEPFMCFKRENVETRDLVNNDWVIKPTE
jgi:hypothetical protein